MVQLCHRQYAYNKSRTQVVSSKSINQSINQSNLQLACDGHVQHKASCGFLKHVLKSYDGRSYRQFCFVEIV